MKKTAIYLTAIVMLAFAITTFNGVSYAGEPQTKCPVMGYDINKKLYVDHDGKRVYFCCSSCPAEFKKDPEKYIKKLEEQGVELEKAPK